MSCNVNTLARRLGKTVHVSPLRYKLSRLEGRFPCESAACVEDWLMAVANARGACVVGSPTAPSAPFTPPSLSELTDEELVVAICQTNGLDRPQMLRLAAQLISRGAVVPERLRLVAERERAGAVLAELARLALKVEPGHPTWLRVSRLLGHQAPLREPLLHWTRLAEPIMKDGRCHAGGWRLVA